LIRLISALLLVLDWLQKETYERRKTFQCSLLIGRDAHVPQPNYERNSKTLLDKSVRVCKSGGHFIRTMWKQPMEFRKLSEQFFLNEITQLPSFGIEQNKNIRSELKIDGIKYNTTLIGFLATLGR
jgi:hypothetical protein